MSTSNSLSRIFLLGMLALWFLAISVILWPELHLGWVAFTPQKSLVWGRLSLGAHLVQWSGLVVLGHTLYRKRSAPAPLFWLLGATLLADVLLTLKARATAFGLQDEALAPGAGSSAERLLYGLPLGALIVGVAILVVAKRLFSTESQDPSAAPSFGISLLWIFLPAFVLTGTSLASVDASLQTAFASPNASTQRRALHWLSQKDVSQGTLESALPLLKSKDTAETAMRALKNICAGDDVNAFLLGVPPLVLGLEDATALLELLRSCPCSSSNQAAIEILNTTSSPKTLAQAASVLFAHRGILGAQSDAVGEWFCGVSDIAKEIHLDVAFTLLRGSDVSRRALARCAMTSSWQGKVAKHALRKSVKGRRQWTLSGLQHEDPSQQELALFRLRKIFLQEGESVDEELLLAFSNLLVEPTSKIFQSALHTLLQLDEQKKEQVLLFISKQNPRQAHDVKKRLEQGSEVVLSPFSPQQTLKEPSRCALSNRWEEAEKCMGSLLQQPLNNDVKRLLTDLSAAPLEPRRLALALAFRSLPPWPKTTDLKTKSALLETLATDAAVSVRMAVLDALPILPPKEAKRLARKMAKDVHKGVREKAKKTLLP